MQNSSENMAWALGLLAELEGWQGFPRTDPSMNMHARAFLEIVESKERGEWLMSEIRNGLTRFPVPLKMRELYNTHFDPADGVHPNDLMAVKYEVE